MNLYRNALGEDIFLHFLTVPVHKGNTGHVMT